MRTKNTTEAIERNAATVSQLRREKVVAEDRSRRLSEALVAFYQWCDDAFLIWNSAHGPDQVYPSRMIWEELGEMLRIYARTFPFLTDPDEDEDE